MRGRVVRLSIPRRLVCDLMHFASGVPSIPVQRRMALGPVVAARSNASERPPWAAIFAKAFARVAAEVPELRRAYCKFPQPHLYEYPRSIASVVLERDHEGEKALFTMSVKDPAAKPLAEIAHAIREAQTAPVESVKPFRRALKFGRCPRPLRRVLWWLALNLGRTRANYFGTFLVTAYSALGVESLHPRSPLTVTLTYGPIAADGSVNVRFIYDHRVMDGATVARALAKMEEELTGAICDELRAMAPAAVATPSASAA
jgi:hypothetical protein